MVKIQYIVYFCPRKIDSIYKLYLINRLHAKSSELVNQLRILDNLRGDIGTFRGEFQSNI